MSPRYTGEATMDEPAIREVERWKEKIEVRLDNRQVFFLFFGSAMVACLLFVLGVIVGKRIESRGRAEAPDLQDPLAVLDGFSQTGQPSSPATTTLTFPRTLLGRGNASTLASTAPAAATQAPPSARVAAAAPAKGGAVPTEGPASPSKPVAPPTVAAKAQPTAAAPAVRAAAPAPRPATDTKSKGRYLLQLSSFQDRKEADAFARRFTGKNAYVVPTDVPGKGTVYRVRVGSYGTFDEAAAAKVNFEREHNVIAYVAGGAIPKP